jgi:plasmid maintenance system antidote protein VapI
VTARVAGSRRATEATQDARRPSAAEESLRAQVRAALAAVHLSQASVARELGVSTKHLSQMLTGQAAFPLAWAERIVALCEMRVEVVVLKGAR